MARTLTPFAKPTSYRCGYRRKCTNPATLYYVVDTLTRSRNLSTRTLCVCGECAAIIRSVFKNVVDAGSETG